MGKQQHNRWKEQLEKTATTDEDIQLGKHHGKMFEVTVLEENGNFMKLRHPKNGNFQCRERDATCERNSESDIRRL
jgi:hypothetical protein